MKRRIIFHPFLFALYTVLGVYSINSVEFPVQWILRPLVVLLIVIAVIFGVVWARVKDPDRAGLITTLILFGLFFGHFHRALFELAPFWNTPMGILLAFIMWMGTLAFFGSKWTWRRITIPGFITSFLNVTSFIVILYPTYIAINSALQIARHAGSYQAMNSELLPVEMDQGSPRPDVYLIILDAYGREDFLSEVFGFDNSEFINYLKRKGFYVASQSSPNYPQTSLSLASLLNMQYLDEYVKDLGHTDVRGPIYDLLRNNAVRSTFKNNGYDFVALPSTVFFTQMRDADEYYRMTLGNINEFEGLLLSATVFTILIDEWGLDVPVPSYALHRRYIFYTLEALETVAKVKGPKFVFAHLMAPHPPFVVDDLENAMQPERPFNMGDATAFKGAAEEYKDGYLGEVRFLNRRMMRVLDSILEQSDQPPVIILQGDHGPGLYFSMDDPRNDCLWERYSILNAYYFPDGDYRVLYDSITPVNSFRIVLNQYLGASLDLLEDKNYYATWSQPYLFSDVTDRARSCSVEQEQ